MIRTLTLENYRSFEKYQVRDLARVNLLVGPNNCGKTSVLEAVELLASGGHPETMLRSGSRREESHGRRSTINHHFRDHRVAPETALSISSDDWLGRIELLVREASDEDPPHLFESDISDADLPPSMPPMALELRRTQGDGRDKVQAFQLTDEGSLDWRYVRRVGFRHEADQPSLPVQFVPTDLGLPSQLGKAWNQVTKEGRESEVEDAMRIIAPDLGSVRFLADMDRKQRPGSATAGFVLGLQGGGPRTPIGSYGEGMRRLLALSLALADSAGGLLLVDEIDTGLHWTAMEDMWKLVLNTAERSKIQVFATTHSLDCILGLAKLLDSHSDLRDGVSIQKIERRLDHSVSLDGEAIITAADLSIELR